MICNLKHFDKIYKISLHFLLISIKELFSYSTREKMHKKYETSTEKDENSDLRFIGTIMVIVHSLSPSHFRDEVN